jgi:sugar phosphate isomerase/epimerase
MVGDQLGTHYERSARARQREQRRTFARCLAFLQHRIDNRIDHRPRRRNRRRCATQRRPPRARLLPGGGDLDVRGFVTAVKSIGYDGPFSIESSYPEFRELDIAEAAALAFDATMKFF